MLSRFSLLRPFLIPRVLPRVASVVGKDVASVGSQEIRIAVGMSMTPKGDGIFLHKSGEVRCVVGRQGDAFHLRMDTLGQRREVGDHHCFTFERLSSN